MENELELDVVVKMASSRSHGSLRVTLSFDAGHAGRRRLRVTKGHLLVPLRRPDLRGGEARVPREFTGRRRVGGAAGRSIDSVFDLRGRHVAVRSRRPSM